MRAVRPRSRGREMLGNRLPPSQPCGRTHRPCDTWHGRYVSRLRRLTGEANHLLRQMRLILHTAVYRLMPTVRDAIPRMRPSARRILHHPAAVAEDRGAGQADREPGQAGVCCQLSGCGAVPRPGWRAQPAPDVSGGAHAPLEPLRSTPGASQISAGMRGQSAGREPRRMPLHCRYRPAAVLSGE